MQKVDNQIDSNDSNDANDAIDANDALKDTSGELNYSFPIAWLHGFKWGKLELQAFAVSLSPLCLKDMCEQGAQH